MTYLTGGSRLFTPTLKTVVGRVRHKPTWIPAKALCDHCEFGGCGVWMCLISRIPNQSFTLVVLVISQIAVDFVNCSCFLCDNSYWQIETVSVCCYYYCCCCYTYKTFIVVFDFRYLVVILCVFSSEVTSSLNCQLKRKSKIFQHFL